MSTLCCQAEHQSVVLLSYIVWSPPWYRSIPSLKSAVSGTKFMGRYLTSATALSSVHCFLAEIICLAHWAWLVINFDSSIYPAIPSSQGLYREESTKPRQLCWTLWDCQARSLQLLYTNLIKTSLLFTLGSKHSQWCETVSKAHLTTLKTTPKYKVSCFRVIFYHARLQDWTNWHHLRLGHSWSHRSTRFYMLDNTLWALGCWITIFLNSWISLTTRQYLSMQATLDCICTGAGSPQSSLHSLTELNTSSMGPATSCKASMLWFA